MVLISGKLSAAFFKIGIRATISTAKQGSLLLKHTFFSGHSSAFTDIICSSATGTLISFPTPAGILIENVLNMDERVDRLEINAQIAENLITEIYSKLSEIEQSSNKGNANTPELIRLRQENEALRLEVAKWKELLIIREIRNGSNPVVRNSSDVGKAVLLPRCQSDIASATVTPIAKIQPTVSVSTKGSNTDAKVPPAAGKSLDNLKKVRFTEDQITSTKLSASNSTTSTSADEIDVSKLDFRIGLITECNRHPDADALYVEKIDLGEEKPRTIISGLVKHVTIENMQNRLVVVLANLKPAKMRGIMSEGMVMCASSPDKVEILIPPPESVPGDLVEIEGFPRNPESVLNPKKKIFETIQPDLKTNDNKEATYKGKLWAVPGKGLIVAETLCNTMIK